MNTITVNMLNEDVFLGRYLNIPLKITTINKDTIIGKIDFYTHDEDPFINYVYINGTLIPFDDIEKIEVLK